jgi:hypothetical protein
MQEGLACVSQGLFRSLSLMARLLFNNVNWVTHALGHFQAWLMWEGSCSKNLRGKWGRGPSSGRVLLKKVQGYSSGCLKSGGACAFCSENSFIKLPLGPLSVIDETFSPPLVSKTLFEISLLIWMLISKRCTYTGRAICTVFCSTTRYFRPYHSV